MPPLPGEERMLTVYVAFKPKVGSSADERQLRGHPLLFPESKSSTSTSQIRQRLILLHLP